MLKSEQQVPEIAKKVPASQIVFNLRGWNPRPAFLVESGWLPRIFCQSMEPHWKQVSAGGLTQDYKGSSYLLFPTPNPGATYSAHFDPTSPYFHAFFGLYIIPPVNGERVLPEVFSEFGNRDNLGWLRKMGDPFPFSVPVQPKFLECVETDELGQGKKWSFITSYKLHASLGDNSPQQGLPEILVVPKSTNSFWKQFIDSYQDIVMTTRGFIWYEGDYLIMNFFNGIEFYDRNFRKIDTYNDYPEFREQMLRMAANVKIINDGTGFSSPSSNEVISSTQGDNLRALLRMNLNNAAKIHKCLNN
ncbi:hypothetical protein G7B40_001225 [Aetokthonos hydrillicola Thurmond2011]|jgi:hypothetical protein|uniref:Uncharacterized protein n=1 Tax=Aetokthonos hydrillicola Thurmond2011 TaxID=2712845 RepID=A0AAP5M703_9CYAN|nr:hypothetical protein [Aetokthonos hydrillicola]MBO3462885.1 hypothetical protein [Aetokthonos hydrillicola CCALA 1050]MBW4589604.1 hypothetical protein [Aetokthonos hydrillicola CCALA 1050]MDR9893207.1 hypothetical protein [Aetokthonos hydrillicola Thurmond2011]